MEQKEQPAADSRQRLDKWLFFSRLVKSRALAQKYISDGQIRVNGRKASQPSQSLRMGDRVELLTWRGITLHVHTVVVLDPGTRRGPFEEARHLYEDLGSLVSNDD